MSKVEGIILVDGQEFTVITVEIDNEKLAREIAHAMSGGLSEGYCRYYDSIVNKVSRPPN